MSITVPQNATVTVSFNKGTEAHTKEIVYAPATSLQVATPDDADLVKHTKEEYADLFKQREAATAESTLAIDLPPLNWST